jgi:thiol-disulfide isomerase/thioredoxin
MIILQRYMRIKITLLCLLITLLSNSTIYAQTQTIKGNFAGLSQTEILLKGFEGFKDFEIAKATTDAKGNFVLKYPKSYVGAALLSIKEGSTLVMLLNKEDIEMSWMNVTDFSTLTFVKSFENNAFTEAFNINQEAENKLAALRYLLPLYEAEGDKKLWIAQEIDIHENRFWNFITELPKGTYVENYLKVRKFISDIQSAVSKNPELIPSIQKNFLTLAINQEMWRSGLLTDVFNGYYYLMEKMETQDEVDFHANSAADYFVEHMYNQPYLLQEIAEHCFKLLQGKGFNASAQYLAEKMLSQTYFPLDQNSLSLYEQYGKLAIGKKGPEVELGNGLLLSQLPHSYKLLVVGASWCPACQNDYPSLVGRYKRLVPNYDLEVVYVSIDTEKTEYQQFFKEAPFITFSDFQGWDTAAVKDYLVSGTPTYILLDKDLQILSRLQKPEDLVVWLEKFGNKK